MLVDRKKRFEARASFHMIPHKADVALQRVEMIDENGEIKSEVREVVIDEAEMISKIPAYTTKIEYIQKYGTLDKDGVVKLHNSSPAFGNMDVSEIVKNIVENDKKE